jgi:hypothetical protein
MAFFDSIFRGSVIESEAVVSMAERKESAAILTLSCPCETFEDNRKRTNNKKERGPYLVNKTVDNLLSYLRHHRAVTCNFVWFD